MGTTLLIVLGVLLVLVVVVIATGRRGPTAPRSISGVAERERAMAAQADVEEHDIEEMLAARDAIRERTGRPSIGEELAEEARREREDEPG